MKRGLRKENEFPTFDRLEAMRFKTFTGGPYETNCFAADTPGGLVLFDAPEGADEAFAGEKVGMLVLTHGHWDHVTDAAAICERHGCPLLCHAETVPMVSEEDFFVRQGFPFRTRAAQVELLQRGIREKIFVLPDATTVLPGHGPATTVGEEKKSNPFVRA